MHVELDVFGQVLALSEALPEAGERIVGRPCNYASILGREMKK